MAASFQEQFVGTLLERSLGAPFLFEPDDYRMGSKQQKVREAADLAWWCRDTAVLMYLTKREKGEADKADAHNFDDARRWLRHWRQGQVLKGRNAARTFAYSFADVENIIVLSVIDVPSGHAWARREPNESVPGAYVTASLPESVLLRLAELAGSAADLAQLISHLSRRQDPTDETEALRLIEEQRTNKTSAAWWSPKVRRDRDVDLDHYIGQTLVEALRHLPSNTLKSPPTLSAVEDMFAIFNDLDWEASVALVAQTADAIRTVRDVPVGAFGPRTVVVLIDVQPYRFVVQVADAEATQDAIKESMATMDRLQKERPSYPPIFVNYMLIGRPEGLIVPTFGMNEQTGPTVTARTLQGIHYSKS